MLSARETILEALAETLGTITDFKTVSRVMLAPNEVSTADAPVLCLADYEDVYAVTGRGIPNKVTIKATAIIYIYTDKTVEAPIKAINDILDKIDVAMAPPVWAQDNEFTLGGLVNHCKIVGNVKKVPGDFDQQSMIIIPFDILCP